MAQILHTIDRLTEMLSLALNTLTQTLGKETLDDVILIQGLL